MPSARVQADPLLRRDHVRLLLIDDNPDDRALVVRALDGDLPGLVVTQVSDRDAFERALADGAFDIVITDFALRWSDGLEVLRAVRARGPELPVVMFTGTGSQEIAVEAMKSGLTDYVVKSPTHFARLPFVVRAALDQERQRQMLRATEELLRHAQKMEALGRLAGGIAHDFNNLLGAIRGHVELLVADLPSTGPAHASALEVMEVTDRATALARQLLRFSRREPTTPALLDLAAVVEGFKPLLRRLLGDQIRLVVDAAPGSFVVADRGQLDQVLMNLAVNARDAMPMGGLFEIVIEHAAEPDAACDGAPDGGCVRLSVRDTGTGMDDETQSHIFEPFFTTKPEGMGTGLGLATVYGIVAAAGGSIRVESAPGTGTRFEILWPGAPADRGF